MKCFSIISILDAFFNLIKPDANPPAVNKSEGQGTVQSFLQSNCLSHNVVTS